MTNDRVRAGTLALGAALTIILVCTVWASPTAAAACPGCRASDDLQAAKKDREKGLLDKVGLGSLRDVPWDAFPAALALSALIGAAGGFVYAGIVGGGPAEDEPTDRESDRPSS